MNFYSFKIEYSWDILSLSPSHISQNIKHYTCFAHHSYPFRGTQLYTHGRITEFLFKYFFLQQNIYIYI